MLSFAVAVYLYSCIHRHIIYRTWYCNRVCLPCSSFDNVRKHVQRSLGANDVVQYPFGSGVELLWTNSAPSSAFATQTIALDLSDFSGVIIKMKSSTTEANSRKFYFDKGSVGYMIIEYYLDNIAGNHAERKVTSVFDTGVTFAGGQYSTGYNDNNYAIPLQIWGVA